MRRNLFSNSLKRGDRTFSDQSLFKKFFILLCLYLTVSGQGLTSFKEFLDSPRPLPGFQKFRYWKPGYHRGSFYTDTRPPTAEYIRGTNLIATLSNGELIVFDYKSLYVAHIFPYSVKSFCILQGTTDSLVVYDKNSVRTISLINYVTGEIKKSNDPAVTIDGGLSSLKCSARRKIAFGFDTVAVVTLVQWKDTNPNIFVSEYYSTKAQGGPHMEYDDESNIVFMNVFEHMQSFQLPEDPEATYTAADPDDKNGVVESIDSIDSANNPTPPAEINSIRRLEGTDLLLVFQGGSQVNRFILFNARTQKWGSKLDLSSDLSVDSNSITPLRGTTLALFTYNPSTEIFYLDWSTMTVSSDKMTLREAVSFIVDLPQQYLWMGSLNDAYIMNRVDKFVYEKASQVNVKTAPFLVNVPTKTTNAGSTTFTMPVNEGSENYVAFVRGLRNLILFNMANGEDLLRRSFNNVDIHGVVQIQNTEILAICSPDTFILLNFVTQQVFENKRIADASSRNILCDSLHASPRGNDYFIAREGTAYHVLKVDTSGATPTITYVSRIRRTGAGSSSGVRSIYWDPTYSTNTLLVLESESSTGPTFLTTFTVTSSAVTQTSTVAVGDPDVWFCGYWGTKIVALHKTPSSNTITFQEYDNLSASKATKTFTFDKTILDVGFKGDHAFIVGTDDT